jgi:hypothetical protein
VQMRKIIFAAVAAVALGATSTAMAAHGGGGGGGHMGGGFGGVHMGGGLGGMHIGGGLGHIGGGLGHIGGGLGIGHLGGGLGVAHLGGMGHSLAPHIASVPSAGGIVGAEPHTFSGVRRNPYVGHHLAFHGVHDHFHHRSGLYAYEPTCDYSPYASAPYYNSCNLDDDPTYN